MKRVCAWCEKVLGETEPLDSDEITHGICEDCKNKILDEQKNST